VFIIEVWKDIAGYEGCYEVSDLGRVRNVRTNRVLSPGISQGYYYVVLCKHGERHNKQVNRLVAEAFIENPYGYPIVNHKDEIKTNNTVGNLEWCTHAYNNTYNDAAKRRGERLKGYTPWNKGKTMPETFRQKVSAGMKAYYSRRDTEDV
jgi:hypothetical protein